MSRRVHIKHNDAIQNSKTENEERLELVITATGVGIWDWMIQTGELSFNQRWAEIIGYEVDELQPLKFDTWADNLHPNDLRAAQDLLERHWRGELALYQIEVRMKHKQGHYVWVLASGKVVEWHSDGKPKRMLGTHLDITERKQREHELIIATELLKESQQVAKVGGWELNLETGNLYWTDETYRIHETSPDEFNPSVDAGVSYFLPDSRELISKALEQAIDHGIGYDLELETLTTKGRKIDVRTTCIVTQKDNKSVRLTGIFQDISEQKSIQRKLEMSNKNLEQANAALQLSAHYDPLTGLPNRILLSDRMQQAMTKCLRHNQSVAIAFIDLDGFKTINDQYGHSTGDKFLQVIAHELKLSLREGDTLARFGGDEFIAVLDGLHEARDSHPILDRLLKSASQKAVINGHPLKVSASIGVTYFPQNNNSPDQLLRHADQAMYKAKQLGKNRWYTFDIEKDAATKHRHEELASLRKALLNEEFTLYYQPKINLLTHDIVGVEALIRWKHPKYGIVPPADFLPIIEQDHLGIEVGEWVIKTALQQLKQWHATPMDVPISVNISPLHLQHRDFIKHLEKTLSEFPKFNENSLEFEILESSALKDIHHTSHVIKACNRLGVTFSIDDFGTGYSSLTYLKQLPAKYLKIDQSFVIDMLTDTNNQRIITGIIELSKAFNLNVIAEGVETPIHGEQLLSLGCHIAQGYGIARPMPAKDFAQWVARWKENPQLVDSNKDSK